MLGAAGEHRRDAGADQALDELRVAVAVDDEQAVEAQRCEVDEAVALAVVGGQRQHQRDVGLGQRGVGAAGDPGEVGVAEQVLVGLVDDEADEAGASGDERAGRQVGPVAELGGCRVSRPRPPVR